MDLIDSLLIDHDALRAALDVLERLLGPTCGVGSEQQCRLDVRHFTLRLAEFRSLFAVHEKAEQELLDLLARQAESQGDLAAAIALSHRSLHDTLKLFDTVAFLCDGEHVYRLRSIFELLRTELQGHLAHEESTLFPALRQGLPEGLLRRLGESVQKTRENAASA